MKWRKKGGAPINIRDATLGKLEFDVSKVRFNISLKLFVTGKTGIFCIHESTTFFCKIEFWSETIENSSWIAIGNHRTFNVKIGSQKNDNQTRQNTLLLSSLNGNKKLLYCCSFCARDFALIGSKVQPRSRKEMEQCGRETERNDSRKIFRLSVLFRWSPWKRHPWIARSQATKK